ncbi:MAG TPA: site-specific DNA-methyltransferase [Kiritimatiellia bacterium]|nr:site-specific DNA-methyltransferase [Kiritimatiellia bacterium]
MPRLDIHFADNLDVLRALPAASIELIYIDPPFNTGRTQARTQIAVKPDADGDRRGFGGRTYRTIKLGTRSYADWFGEYLAFLEPRLVEARRVLATDGSLILHLDCREVHYAKVLLDQLFGRASFINEIIWAYDYGARSKRRWPAKHDTLLWYARDPKRYVFNLDACDRIPYMAPGLVGPEKAARGKTPTDVWWHTVVSPTGREKTGYPTQKPRGILDRIVKVHSRPGARLLDFFAGSGSFGAAAWDLWRDCILVDNNRQALEVMEKRFAKMPAIWHGWPVHGSKRR